jgi:MFS family permease
MSDAVNRTESQNIIDENGMENKAGGKLKPGEAWKMHEQHLLPKNNLPLVFFGMMLAVFLAALDQMIVSTALPTISARLGGGSKYSWVGAAYLLSSAALAPLYGKLSDVMGRKLLLYGVMIVFLLGSLLCGVAQSMNWLIICRAIQGAGGGGIIQVGFVPVELYLNLTRRNVLFYRWYRSPSRISSPWKSR